MDAQEPLTREQGRALLEYAQLTYEAVTSYRRRVARVALAMAAIVGVMCIFSATQWLSTSNRVSEVTDETLVDTMGVRIPDPRPALERGQLRVIAALWEFVTIASGVIPSCSSRRMGWRGRLANRGTCEKRSAALIRRRPKSTQPPRYPWAFYR